MGCLGNQEAPGAGFGGHRSLGIAEIAGKAGREDGEGVIAEISEIALGENREIGWTWMEGMGTWKGTFRCQRGLEDSQQGKFPNQGGILAGLVKAWNSQISGAAGDGHSPDSRGSLNALGSG